MLYCMEDLLGGPKPFKVRSAVNLQVILLDECIPSDGAVEGRDVRVRPRADDSLSQLLLAAFAVHILSATLTHISFIP